MLGLGLAVERPDIGALGAAGMAAFAYMALVPMALCYVAWFATLRRLPPSTAATGMLLVPVLGTASASAMLGEPFGWRMAASMALTLGGVAIALRAA